MAAGSPGRTRFRLLPPPSAGAMNHAAVAPGSRRPRGLTASDRSTMRSLLPPTTTTPSLPPLTPPLPSRGRTFQPPDRSYEVGKTERNRRQQACVVGPPPAGNTGSRVGPGSTATVGNTGGGEGARPRRGEVQLLLSFCVFLGSVEVWQPAGLLH